MTADAVASQVPDLVSAVQIAEEEQGWGVEEEEEEEEGGPLDSQITSLKEAPAAAPRTESTAMCSLVGEELREAARICTERMKTGSGSSQQHQELARRIMPRSQSSVSVDPIRASRPGGSSMVKRAGSHHGGRDRDSSSKDILSQKEAWRTLGNACPPPAALTCEAWTIFDSTTGEVLGRHHDMRRLPMASLTKMATACVVLEIAARSMEKGHSQVLDELIHVSQRAARTIGSTAKLRKGDRFLVREALYAMLLPSGNDASVALAEHFGERCRGLWSEEGERGAQEGTRIKSRRNSSQGEDPEKVRRRDAYNSFVAAMNQLMTILHLKRTQFSNPHGLHARDHWSCASDLAKLCGHAMKSHLFRDIVKNESFTCHLLRRTKECNKKDLNPQENKTPVAEEKEEVECQEENASGEEKEEDYNQEDEGTQDSRRACDDGNEAAMSHPPPNVLALVPPLPEGYNRIAITWENTNKLLGKNPAIDGCKTGVTPTARYCMALSGISQEGVRLHAVTLASPTTQERWDDLEKIFEWGWKFAALAREKGLLPVLALSCSTVPSGPNLRRRRVSKPDLPLPPHWAVKAEDPTTPIIAPVPEEVQDQPEQSGAVEGQQCLCAPAVKVSLSGVLDTATS